MVVKFYDKLAPVFKGISVKGKNDRILMVDGVVVAINGERRMNGDTARKMDALVRKCNVHFSFKAYIHDLEKAEWGNPYWGALWEDGVGDSCGRLAEKPGIEEHKLVALVDRVYDELLGSVPEDIQSKVKE